MAMQAFSGPWGPLVAPAIPEGTDVAGAYNQGVQNAVANNNAIRRLERINQLYALGEQKLQMQHEFAMDRDQRAIDRLQAQKERWADLYYLSDAEHQRKVDNATTRLMQANNASDAMTKAQSAINALRLSDDPQRRPGGSQFPSLAADTIAQYAPALQPKDQLSLRNQVATEHNAAHASAVSTYKMMKDNLDSDVGNVLGYDANLKPDYSGVFRPWTLKPETAGGIPLPGAGFFGLSPKPTGNYVVNVKSGAGETIPHSVAPQQLTQFNDRYKNLQKQYDTLTTSRFMNDPEAGVTGTGDPDQAAMSRYKKAMTVYSSPNATDDERAVAAKVLFPGQ